MIEVLKHTRSICSTCGEIVPATYKVRDQEQVFFTRRCSTHGCIGYVRRVTHDEIADAVG